MWTDDVFSPIRESVKCSQAPVRPQSRYKRRDCVQVVTALVVTPDGLPLAYEVMAGNTSDNTTLADFLAKIEDQYGRSDRVWIMDRGIPTEGDAGGDAR